MFTARFCRRTMETLFQIKSIIVSISNFNFYIINSHTFCDSTTITFAIGSNIKNIEIMDRCIIYISIVISRSIYDKCSKQRIDGKKEEEKC